MEAAKGEKREEFSLRHGDWGQDVALLRGRKRGRLRLGELGEFAGGVDYAAVGQAVTRFGKRMVREPGLRRPTTRDARSGWCRSWHRRNGPGFDFPHHIRGNHNTSAREN